MGFILIAFCITVMQLKYKSLKNITITNSSSSFVQILKCIFGHCKCSLCYLSTSHLLGVWDGCPVQHVSRGPAWCISADQKGSSRQITRGENSILGFCWAQMALSEAGGPRMELVRKIRGMQACWCWCLGRKAPWPLTVHPNGGNFIAPQGNGLQMYPFPSSYLHASVPSIWSMNEAIQQWVGVMWRTGMQSLCVLWSLSYGFSLSGLSPGAQRESGSVKHPYFQNLSSSIQPGNALHRSITFDIKTSPCTRTEAHEHSTMTQIHRVKIHVAHNSNWNIALYLDTGKRKQDTKENKGLSTSW